MKRIYLGLSLLVFISFDSFGQTTLTEDVNGVLNTGKVVAQTSAGQTFFVGHQLGTSYSYPSSGIFRAWTDQPTGSANYFYDGVLNTTITYSVRADGQGYFAGNLGVGTTTPGGKLEISSLTQSGTSDIMQKYTWGADLNNWGLRLEQQFNATISSIQYNWIMKAGNTSDLPVMSFSGGNVLIGQTSSKAASPYKLDVAGNVRANQITVNVTGADFVFEPTYSLLSLSDLKRYIDQNHHLPEIESAKQMQAAGLNLGENQTKLLQKIEELTLYLIEKDKQISNQQDEINQLKAQAKQSKIQQIDIDELKTELGSLLKNQPTLKE